MSAKQIYENFTTATGTDALQAAQAAAQQIAQDMPHQAAEIKRLQDQMASTWTGAASDAAQGGVSPLALEFMNVSDTLHTSQDLMSRQAGSFHTAANAVQPVPPAPQLNVFGTLAGGPSMDQQFRNYLDSSQHNVMVYNQYYGASQYNTSNMPVTYGNLVDSTPNVTVADPVAPAASGAGATPAHRSATSVPAASRGAAASPHPASEKPLAVRPVGPPPSSGTSTTTSTSGYASPPPLNTSTAIGPTNLLPTSEPPASPNSPSINGLPVVSRPDLPRAAGQRPGFGGEQDGQGEPGDTSGPGARIPGGTSRGVGVGGRGGALDQGPARAAAAAEQVASAERGVVGPGGVIGSGGRRAQEKDDERLSKYVTEDLAEVFGPAPPVAPPVLGLKPPDADS